MIVTQTQWFHNLFRQHFVAPLDAKKDPYDNNIDNKRHPGHYLIALWLRSTALLNVFAVHKC